MNRRRFLKYAGATAAVVGGSALGLDYLMRPTQPIEQTIISSSETISTTALSGTSSVTTTETSTTGELPPLDLGANDLGGYVFHDYSGNGALDEGEPFVNDVEMVAQGYYATFKVEPQNGIYVFKNLPSDWYRLYPVHPQNRFRYMCRSNAELVETKQGYTVDFRGRTRQDMALMEGFLTLPYPSGTKYIVGRSYMEGRYYDRDPSPQTYLWWNGETGAETLSGLFANSAHTDIGADYGTPVVASAPGQVSYLGVDTVGGGLVVEIRHDVDNLGTNYIHLSKQLVSVGQRVGRGEIIGLSGPGQLPGQVDVFQHTAFSLFYYEENGVAFVDPYRSSNFVGSPGYWFSPYGAYGQSWILTSAGDPIHNLITYWTKDNEPQYSIA